MPNPSDIAIMLDDRNLVRLVTSWPKMTEQQRGEASTVAIIANISRYEVENVIIRARAHGLIYDNGTVNEFAQKYVNSLVANSLIKQKARNA